MTEFTIFLVDDDPAVLKAVGRLLEAAGYQTKAYSSADAFLRDHDASIPGCVVLDLAMPRFNGLDVQETLAGKGINRPVIYLTGTATIPDSVRAMRAGAVDFLLKPVDKIELLKAVESAEERDKMQRLNEKRRNAVLHRMAKLTPREKQVLDHVVKGSLNKQIGADLGVHEKTIKVHRARVFNKMGVKNLAELVRLTVAINPEG